MFKPVYILVNPQAHQGKAWKRWLKIKDRVLDKIPTAREIVIENGFNPGSDLKQMLEDGGTIISAGGDGSVHFLINNLLKDSSFDKLKIAVGAIGLGSSNDFHKPFQTSIDSIPVRINIEKPASWHDAGRVRYTDEKGNQKEKYFIVNASFGATAQGNWNFNNPGAVLKWLKKTNTAAAINYTSLSTILTFKNRNCQIQYDGVSKSIPVSNINILKIPYVAGTMHYNQVIQPDDGRMGLNICDGMSRFELIKTLVGLQKGKFIESEKKVSTYTNRFILESEKPVAFECDGETEKASRIDISLMPKAIQILRN